MESSRQRPAAASAPRPVLRPRDAFAITIGIVVGAGIFRMPSLVAGASGSEAVMLGAWLVVIALLYLLINLAYLKVLGMGGMAQSDAVAADVMQHVFGGTGAVLMSAIVVAAALTSANATLITGARSVYAVGHDFPALAFIGRWDGRSGSPGTERPFRVPLYPLLPLLFCVTCAYLLYSSLAYTGFGALAGLGVLAVGGALLRYLRPSETHAPEST